MSLNKNLKMRIILPRFNANYNKTRDETYYNYSAYIIKPGKIDLFRISSHMGRGKYSEVFIGKYKEKKIVIKVLKPIKTSKINREILVMKNLDHPNILKLRDVVRDDSSGMFSLIFNYIEHQDPIEVFKKSASDPEVFKCYMKQLMTAIHHAHSRGIMHRDIKPHNMIITGDKKLILIDWGLAEFYHPREEYSVRVASRFYKSPELLLNYPYYDYSLDIWSFGCVMAEILFEKRPFFYGKSDCDQLVQIANVLGVKDLQAYAKKYQIVTSEDLCEECPYERVQIKSLICDKKYTLFEDAIDLLEKIFVYDHNLRPTSVECLEHKFFN